MRVIFLIALLLSSPAFAQLGGGVTMQGGTVGRLCGDGLVQSPEQCDLGAGNGACPSTCSATCSTNSCGASAWGPTSFSSSLFTGMTSGSIGCGTQTHRSQTSRSPNNFCNGAVNWSFVRTQKTDDSWQCCNAGSSATVAMTDTYLATCDGTGLADHADNLQFGSFSSATQVNGTFNLTRVTLDETQSASCDQVGAGLRVLDVGKASLVTLDHVYCRTDAFGRNPNTGIFDVAGQCIRIYTPDGTPFTASGGMHVWIDGLCFDSHSDGIAGSWNGGTITVDHYANVFSGCSLDGSGNVVTGAPLSCSSWIHNNVGGAGGPGTVTGCPN